VCAIISTQFGDYHVAELQQQLARDQTSFSARKRKKTGQH
jgi:hypothetical protein